MSSRGKQQDEGTTEDKRKNKKINKKKDTLKMHELHLPQETFCGAGGGGRG